MDFRALFCPVEGEFPRFGNPVCQFTVTIVSPVISASSNLSPFGHEKSPCSPKGTRTESTNSAVPPCLPYETATSARCQYTVCPITLALRQKILRLTPVPSALGGPFAAPLFAPLSAMRNSLWMRLQFYFRFVGFMIKLCLLYTIGVHLSSTFFHSGRTFFYKCKTTERSRQIVCIN